MSQAVEILKILNDGNFHCVTEILEKMYIVDYRRRMCDLKEQGHKLISEPCGGRCGRNHSSGVHRWQLVREQKALW